jgi:hypothetical protein
MKAKPDAMTKEAPAQNRQRLEEELEEGLRGTFPASDALACTQPVHKPPPKC